MRENTNPSENAGLRPRRTRQRLVALTVAAVGGAAIAAAGPANTALASTNSGTQAVTATVLSGTLLVTPPVALVTNLTPGTNNANIALGTATYTNTLAASTAWSATLSSNDWSFSGAHIPFTGMTVTPGSTIAGTVGAVGTPTAAAGGTLAGTDTTPGTTQSSPVTLINGTGSTQGTFTQAGSTISVVVPGGLAAGAYLGTLTYTLTG